MTARAACWVVAGILTLVALPSGAAAANTESLKRAFENTTQGPIDGLLTPVVAAQTAYRNVSAEGHSVAGTITLGTITGVGLFLFDGAAAFFRTFAGAAELPFALGSLAASPWTSWSPPPFFDVDRVPALVDHPTSWYHVKFGVYHLGSRE